MGESWEVHGGGFYHVQKYRVAPRVLPERLAWFKWEAYTTWLSGFALLCIVYFSNARAYLIDDVSEIDPKWLAGVETLGITSGASAPEFLVEEIVRKLGGPDAIDVEEVITVNEDVHFPLPPEVSGARRSGRPSETLPTRS